MEEEWTLWETEGSTGRGVDRSSASTAKEEGESEEDEKKMRREEDARRKTGQIDA